MLVCLLMHLVLLCSLKFGCLNCGFWQVYYLLLWFIFVGVDFTCWLLVCLFDLLVIVMGLFAVWFWACWEIVFCFYDLLLVGILCFCYFWVVCVFCCDWVFCLRLYVVYVFVSDLIDCLRCVIVYMFTFVLLCRGIGCFMSVVVNALVCVF